MSRSEALNPLEKNPGKKKPRKGIQSIETGFRILDAIASSKYPPALKDIAAVCSMPPANVQFYLVSLAEVGMIIQNTETSRYSLGPSAMRIALSSLEKFDLFNAAKEHMLELSRIVGHTVFLGVWGNHGPTIVQRTDGASSQSIFELRVGSVLPLLSSALGRNFLAHLPAANTKYLLEKELKDISKRVSTAESMTELPRGKKQVDALKKSIIESRIAQCRGTILSDYTAISAPIFDISHTMIAGLTIMGPTGTMDDSTTGKPAELLKAAALNISKAAGFKPSDSKNT